MRRGRDEFKSLASHRGVLRAGQADFYDQLVFNVGVRNDGFSTFGASQSPQQLPQGRAAWTFTNFGNQVMKRLVLLRQAARRVRRDRQGAASVRPSPLSAHNTFGSGFGDAINTMFGHGGIVSGAPWVTTPAAGARRETEFGGDFGFFNSSADLSLTAYNKRDVT